MPQYEVVAREQFVIFTTYRVTAANAVVAEHMCRTGAAAYDTSTPDDDPGKWLETVSVKEMPDGFFPGSAPQT